MAGEIFVVGLCADHGGVVAGEREVGHIERAAGTLAFFREAAAQERVCGDAARDDELFMAGLVCGVQEVAHEAIDNGLAVRGRKIGDVDGLALLLGIMQNVDDGGLEAGEAEIERGAVYGRARELERFVVAGLSEFIHGDAAGIGHAHGARSLIERFARGIVTRFSEDAELCVVRHFDDVRVTAGDDKAQERRLEFRVRDVV